MFNCSPYIGCARNASIHFPDLLRFTLVWFVMDIPEIDRDKNLPCMHRHLFEHTSPEVHHKYETGPWTIRVEDYTFRNDFATFFIENIVPLDTYILLRHIGNFTFKALMFDKDEISLNFWASPSGSCNTSSSQACL
ncbi:unnamed protein product [Cuscuta epithymum]|uniref:Uncharacterized protein n=1 Tax=Cuscuta epithymum TaxID=186058 RepID=A0AAV0F2K0_9ASTE|nr:unnamed protein product [Cuscuta epithymum]